MSLLNISNMLELSGLFVYLGDLLIFSVLGGREKKCWFRFAKGEGGGSAPRLTLWFELWDLYHF